MPEPSEVQTAEEWFNSMLGRATLIQDRQVLECDITLLGMQIRERAIRRDERRKALVDVAKEGCERCGLGHKPQQGTTGMWCHPYGNAPDKDMVELCMSSHIHDLIAKLDAEKRP